MTGTGSEIVIQPRSEDLDPSDRRWIEAVADLKREVKEALRDEDGTLQERETPMAGTKGGVPELVLALGTSGAISAAVVAFKAWLAQGRSREIRIQRREGGKTTEVSITGVGLNEKHFVEQIEAVLGNAPATPPRAK
jgi:hypothetical protein